MRLSALATESTPTTMQEKECESLHNISSRSMPEGHKEQEDIV